MKDTTEAFIRKPFGGVQRASISVTPGGSQEEAVDSLRIWNKSAVEPCLETEVNCNGITVTVRTCCKVGESSSECVARHAEAVEHACD